MSKSRKHHKQGLWVGILALAIVVCVWLTPVSSVIAASGSSEFSVTVTVQATIEVDMSDSIFDITPGEDVDVKIVNQVGSDSMPDLNGDNEGTSILVVTVSRL